MGKVYLTCIINCTSIIKEIYSFSSLEVSQLKCWNLGFSNPQKAGLALLLQAIVSLRKAKGAMFLSPVFSFSEHLFSWV